jgi:hypothetical protein
MIRMTERTGLLVCVLVLLAAANVQAAERTFACQEITGRDWPRTLVTYKSTQPPGDVRLVDANGVEVPCQWSRQGTRLSFYAELKSNSSYRYELQPGKPAQPATLPTAAVKDGFVTLDNGVVAIRLPAGKRDFKTPLAFCADHARAAANAGKLEQAGLAFGPIAGVRLADGHWVGGSYFTTEPIEAVRLRQQTIDAVPPTAWARAAAAAPSVTGYETTVIEKGPLFIEARIRFTFSNGGDYQLTARLLANDPAIRIDEVMDLKTTSAPDDPLYVGILLNDGGRKDGWRPDCVYGYATRMSERCQPLEDAAQGQGFTNAIASTASLPIRYDKDSALLANVTVLYPWDPSLHYAGLVSTAQLQKDKNAPFLAIVPQHGGTWRGAGFVFPPKTPMLFQQLLSHANGDVEMRWTIRNQPHAQNLLHTGEYDPDFGLTGMRRLWNLVGGPFQYHETLYSMRASEGYINLDNYKDWTLAWSDDTKAGVARPPDKEQTAKNPVLDLLSRCGFAGDFGVGPWWSTFRFAEQMTWAVEARKSLADPAVPAERKGLLRAQVAALCYLLAEPDCNTRASAMHQGNPNMPINRFFGLPLAAVLIPDHPLAGTWMEVSRDYLQYALGRNVTLGNGFSELCTYYGASAPTYVHAALVLQETKRLDERLRKLALSPVTFSLALLPPPDPRFGVRMIPGFGHEGVQHINQWLPAAALVKDVDPDLAAVYAWAWKEQGKPGESQHCSGFALLTAAEGQRADTVKPEAIKKAIHSSWIPGFGAVLHSHHGDPQETYLGYRQGYFSSHSDSNQGDFVLYAKGAPITTLSLFGYALGNHYRKISDEFGFHSVVRTGSQQNDGGWPGGGLVSGVHRHFFSDSIDYLRGVGDTSATIEKDAVGRDLTAPDAQRWTRQILFLKGKTPASPNYFLFRDSFRSLRGTAANLTPKWWYQRTLGGKDQVQSNPTGFAYTSAFGPRLDVHFLQPAQVAVESRAADATGTVGGGGGGAFIPKYGEKTSEELTVTAVGPVAAGQDIMVAMYPRAKDEAAATFQSLGDSAAKIVTPESTDYVFLNTSGMSFQQGDVAFQGLAGAVRVFPNEVHLTVTEGAGTVTYKGCTLKAGKPVTRVVSLAEIGKGGTIEVPADPVTLAFALDDKAGTITNVQPGVKKQVLPNGVAWLFDSPAPLRFAQDGVEFEGQRGGILVDATAGTTRLVMLDGTKIASGSACAEMADGPYDLTYYHDKVVGIAEGPARLLYLSRPPGLNAKPCIRVDGVSYAPGSYDGNDEKYCQHVNVRNSIVPLLGGRREFTLENLKQPSVFRSWKQW